MVDRTAERVEANRVDLGRSVVVSLHGFLVRRRRPTSNGCLTRSDFDLRLHGDNRSPRLLPAYPLSRWE